MKDGIIGGNKKCQYYPCHFEEQNCTFCFCPFYPCKDKHLGRYVISKSGGKVWSCQDCLWMHRDDVVLSCFNVLKNKDFEKLDESKLEEIKLGLEKKFQKKGRSLMVLGTTSGAGKSIIVAALCRIFSNRGYNVSPFKSQNMSLNSVVTKNGEEVATIQALQARAARVAPMAYMNPILLKPKGDCVSQVIVDGKPYKDMDVDEYYNNFTKSEGVKIIKKNFDFLKRIKDIIVIEGAGSPAEINIKEYDIANMKMAEIAGAKCILVVNIEWGGSFAYIYGTLKLLEEKHRRRFIGIIINNMRGNAECLKSGIEKIEREFGIPVLGVVPHIELSLPAEDSMFIGSSGNGASTIKIGIIKLPRISNFTDFDALTLENNVSIVYVNECCALDSLDAIIIPGTKNTVADLKWLKEKGLFDAVKKLSGTIPVLGICGGYQMLGEKIVDVRGIEGGKNQEIEGLGLLDVVTYFDRYEKKTVQVEGVLHNVEGSNKIRGYEMHMGKTENKSHKPLFKITDEEGFHLEGACSDDKRVFGTYLHGVFDLPAFRSYFMKVIGSSPRPRKSFKTQDYSVVVEENLEKLAHIVESNIDIERIVEILELQDV